MQPNLPTLNIEYIYLVIYRALTGANDIGSVSSVFRTIAPYSIVLSILLIFGIIFCIVRISRMRIDFYTDLRRQVAENTGQATAAHAERGAKNPKWQRVMGHIESSNPNDWRLAIMEADVMLEELAQTIGYRGETLGDKLKSVERSDFTNIDKAWEAHRIRNRIAHEGSDFQLTEREAKRAVELYRAVFEEFRFI
jgi:hypothetical protein